MGEDLEELLESERVAWLTALEEAVRLAQMGDFRQAALRYAAFRRGFDEASARRPLQPGGGLERRSHVMTADEEIHHD